MSINEQLTEPTNPLPTPYPDLTPRQRMTGTRTIPLSRGLETIVDAADFEWLSQYKWYASPSRMGWRVQRHFSVGNGKQSTLLIPRVIMSAMNRHIVVDHIDRNPLNNTRANLRLATNQQNSQNCSVSTNNSSGFKGVSWETQKGRWRASIGVDMRQKHLGYFDDPEEAARAYDAAARRLFGEFAWTNFEGTK